MAWRPRGVSVATSDVTRQMVFNFVAGGAGINVLARQTGARVTVVDAGIQSELPPLRRLVRGKIRPGTADLSVGPAMTRAEAEAALALGVRCVEEEVAQGLDLLACGEMGIGNTTPATAMICAVTGASPGQATGLGTGIPETARARKIALIESALAVNRPDPSDGLDLLAKIGGLEIAAMTGAMLQGGGAPGSGAAGRRHCDGRGHGRGRDGARGEGVFHCRPPFRRAGP